MNTGKNGKVSMLGEQMKVLVSADCVTDISPDEAMRLPKITAALCKTLHLRDVAKFLLLKVCIGNTVALVDKNAGYIVGGACLCTKTIWIWTKWRLIPERKPMALTPR